MAVLWSLTCAAVILPLLQENNLTIQHEKLFTQNITFIYKLLPNHFDEYFIPLCSIHYHSTRLATSKNLFLPRVNSSSGKCSLKFIGLKVWSSLPDDIKFWTTFIFKWKLKKHLIHEKIPNYELSNISHVQNKILCALVFCNSVLFFVCIYFSVYIYFFL